jgi:hypothetical protein
LRSPWVAFDLAADAVAQARLLRRAHEVALAGGGTPAVLRGVIIRSWERCAAAGVDPDSPAPIVLDEHEAAARLVDHPLVSIVPLVRSLVGHVTGQARHLVLISDAEGLLLWREGHAAMLEAARVPQLTPGALCSEPVLGTNAVGTVLELRHPVHVFAAEHYNRLLHGWTGAGAPVLDTLSGTALGVVAVCGSFRHVHPHTLALATAVAHSASAQLAQVRERREADLVGRYLDRIPAAGRRPSALVAADGRVLAASPRGWLPERIKIREGIERTALPKGGDAAIEPAGDGARIVWGVRRHARPIPLRVLTIRALGPDPPVLALGGAALPLTLRQAELLVVLAMHPAGLSARALAQSLYGPPAKPVTARAEVARVRRIVGELVAAQPYRLAAEVHADFADLERLLERGRVALAVDRYPGPLLPGSRAPAIAARRAALEAAFHDAVRASADASLARRWERTRRRGEARAASARAGPRAGAERLAHIR